MMEIAVASSRTKKSTFPSRGERVAAWVEDYLQQHGGLTLSELAFRVHADKRDLQRLIRDRSIGHALEDALHAYFGEPFGHDIYGALWGAGPSKRERELDRERAELAARRERLERLRAEDREAAAVVRARRRMAAGDNRGAGL